MPVCRSGGLRLVVPVPAPVPVLVPVCTATVPVPDSPLPVPGQWQCLEAVPALNAIAALCLVVVTYSMSYCIVTSYFVLYSTRVPVRYHLWSPSLCGIVEQHTMVTEHSDKILSAEVD